MIESHSTRHRVFLPLLVAKASQRVAETELASLISSVCIVA